MSSVLPKFITMFYHVHRFYCGKHILFSKEKLLKFMYTLLEK